MSHSLFRKAIADRLSAQVGPNAPPAHEHAAFPHLDAMWKIRVHEEVHPPPSVAGQKAQAQDEALEQRFHELYAKCKRHGIKVSKKIIEAAKKGFDAAGEDSSRHGGRSRLQLLFKKKQLLFKLVL